VCGNREAGPPTGASERCACGVLLRIGSSGVSVPPLENAWDVSETEVFLRRREDHWEERRTFPWVIVQRCWDAVVGMMETNVTGRRASRCHVIA